MKSFHCTHCQNLVFFENVRCLSCEHSLAYLPDLGLMAAIERQADGSWQAMGISESAPTYRLCENYQGSNVCNWAVQDSDPGNLCSSCRLTRVIPDLSSEQNRNAWFKLEQAKRRLVYSLQALRLPLNLKSPENETGLAFEFLQDGITKGGDAERVMTGHDNGVITVNIAEADDVYRERQRTLQHEPYRTLLGHFRHESGHYYWDRLIAEGPHLQGFRQLFGDEQQDYPRCLRRHYDQGPPQNWQENFISAYATAHPWEDWAECWAHYLHMLDALETASSAGLSLIPKRAGEPVMPTPADPLTTPHHQFERMIAEWVSLTYVLNNLSRGLGVGDAYPFLLSTTVIRKLRFIHERIADAQ